MTRLLNDADFARFADTTTLVIQRWLPGPVDRIWSYLTDSALRSKWLAAGDMDLTPAAPFELVWRNDDLSKPGERPDGFAEVQRMGSRIIAVDPMRMLSFAWGKGSVTFLLEPKGDKVLLTLTHTGLDDHATRGQVAPGWHMHLDILRARIAQETPASFWSGWIALRELYADRLSA